jgi:arabinose-5-phosphate isomerase
MTDNLRDMDWLAKAREVLSVEVEGLEAVRAGLGEGFLTAMDLLLHRKGRVVVTGLGKSGLVGRKIAATLSSTGTAAYFLHPVEGAHGDLGMIREGDVVLAISNSGETDELLSILPALKAMGAALVALTAKSSSSLARLCDAVVEVAVPREACPLGMAPTASTTACLAVGDALAVCLMEAVSFNRQDFKRFHPGGVLGSRLALSVGELMHAQDLPTAPATTTLGQALAALDAGKLGLVALVHGDGRLAGVLSDGDVRRLACRNELVPERPVAGVMTAKPACVEMKDRAAQALDLMEERQITVLPVLGPEGTLVGIVHLHDLLGKGRLKFSA